MNMIPMLDVLPEIIIDVPNCPNPIAQRALRDCLMDFCRRSEAWHVRQDYGVTVADQPNAVLDIPEHTRFVKVLSLTHDGHPLNPASEKMLDNQVDNWRSHKGCPHAFYEVADREIRLYPTPTETEVGVLSGTLSIAPTRSATEIDADLFDSWLEGIVAGAQYRLFMMPDKSWTHPQLAMMLSETFETAITHARRYSRNDHQSKGARVTAYGGY